ncbi:phosphatase 2C-like domain-containing protein [Pelagophyceae sp. CCMP2097]|nr:phosphatase 2C-like domain-containing protein [Pelagophyceae sp. CCMP2097]
MEGVAYGSAAAASKKDEDRWACAVGKDAAYFGLFDGHGGAAAADLCASDLERRARLLMRAPAGAKPAGAKPGFVAAANAACWSIDGDLAGGTAGTTATLLWVERDRAELAWLGDSTALRVDMCAPNADAYEATRDHKPSDAGGVALMEAIWLVRHEVAYAAKSANSADSVDAADAAGGPTGPAEGRAARARVHARQAALLPGHRRGLLWDALARSRRMDAQLRAAWGSKGSASPQRTRENSLCARRVDPRTGVPRGPLVVFSRFSRRRADGGVDDVLGPSTQVTRSIGDWDASRSVLPELEARGWAVGPDAFDRVVLATDGLWDVVSHADAVRLVKRRGLSPQRAAEVLLRCARGAYARKGGGVRDDVTVVVVDINPSGLDCAVPPRFDWLRPRLFAACGAPGRRYDAPHPGRAHEWSSGPPLQTLSPQLSARSLVSPPTSVRSF